MSDKKTFYITTTLPYVNADPHIGFAMEIIRADVIARSKKLEGYEVFFNTGTDEHGQKIHDAAEKQQIDIQKYVDSFAERFQGLQGILGISPDVHFVRTTDAHHIVAAQEFWKRCDANGDIYKKNYSIKYCVGCELEKTESELDENGRCLIHPNLEIEIINEENYFFRWSKYQQPLLDFYTAHPDFVVPSFRFNEIKAFVERGLEDFSISRLKSKMSWGVPVPGDPDHVVYVWFDALVSYISTLGWPEDAATFEKFWIHGTPVQYAGKDNLRQQSAMWQSMLMSAQLPNSDKIIINGFINSNGQKMSKSLGNVVNPYDLVAEYGTDALRYYVLREFSAFEDSDFTMEKFKEAYNANLANGLGNLVARVMKMAEDNLKSPLSDANFSYKFEGYLKEKLDEFRIDSAMDYIWGRIGELDKEIQEKKPWESKDKEVLQDLVKKIGQIGHMLQPFLPRVSEIIIDSVRKNKKPETLFPRKD